MDQQGRIQWIFGEPPANMNDVSPNRRFGLAGGIALSQGYLFVADPLDGTIHVLNTKGEEVAQLGDMGSGDGQFDNPVMVAATTGDELAVTEWGNARVQIFAVDPQQAIAAWQDQGGSPGAPRSVSESSKRRTCAPLASFFPPLSLHRACASAAEVVRMARRCK